MNETTAKAFDALLKVAKDNSQVSRLLWEPDVEDNSYPGLARMFDRSDIEEAWQAAATKEQRSAWDMMQHSMQNDFIAGIHRDMVHRYTGRIQRHLAELARKEQHADKTGLPTLMKTLMESNLSSYDEKVT